MVNMITFIQALEQLFFMKPFPHKSPELASKIDRICINYLIKHDLSSYLNVYRKTSKKLFSLKFALLTIIYKHEQIDIGLGEIDKIFKKTELLSRLRLNDMDCDFINQFKTFYLIIATFETSIDKKQKLSNECNQDINFKEKFLNKNHSKSINTQKNIPKTSKIQNFTKKNNFSKKNKIEYKLNYKNDQNELFVPKKLLIKKQKKLTESLKNNFAVNKSLANNRQLSDKLKIIKISNLFENKLINSFIYYLNILNKILTIIDLHRLVLFRKGFDIVTLFSTDSKIYFILSKELKHIFGNKINLLQLMNTIEKILPYNYNLVVIKAINLVINSKIAKIIRSYIGLRLLKKVYIFVLISNNIIYGPLYYFQAGFITFIKIIIDDESFNNFIISFFVDLFKKNFIKNFDQKKFIKNKISEFVFTILEIFYKNTRKNFLNQNKLNFRIRNSKSMVYFIFDKFIKYNKPLEKNELADILYFIWIYSCKKCKGKFNNDND
ncbi:hypothetical protein DMUE_3842 [Dictyocoela muelleri]|nr:hypothetical protein DMUE_3842 [Dictyocoela muelleri]